MPCTEGSFNAVTSTQVYEYVEDVPAALTEAVGVAGESWARAGLGYAGYWVGLVT